MKDDNDIPGFQVINRMVPGQPSAALLDTQLYLRNLARMRRSMSLDDGALFDGNPVQPPHHSARPPK
jgi:hypothetical protein